ncbi:MAG: hypothetical protein V9G04_18805 [Nocardioides sp.]|jgi:hypothetical protein
MSRRVYLHIGAPKTGTTYVQDRLSINRDTLLKHGIDFPTNSRKVDADLFHFRAALDVLGQDWGGPTGHAAGAWDAMTKLVARSRHTVVISHEIFAPATAEQIEKILDGLRGRDVHVVYSARDLGRQLPAAWQESIKQGRKWPFRRFLNKVEQGSTWFYKAFDLPAVLERWSQAVPLRNVHVVTVPPGTALRANKDLLWHRMCETFEIDPAWAPEESHRANKSLGVAETQVLRQLNRRMERVVRREAAFDELIREKLAHDLLSARKSDPVRLPPQRFDWADDRAEEWIQWLATSGVHVVGDVEELRPVRPAEDAKWVNPDAMRPKLMLNGALDALAAMTMEAASRSDPSHSRFGRVREVRERLLGR